MANLKYDEMFLVKVAEYAAKGDTDARIAARLGIGLTTFYTYKEQFPEFAEGLLAGRRICYSRVRARLLQVARGQCTLTTKVFKNGELYKTTERNLPPNLKAIIYFQKHMRVGGRLSGDLCWPHGHKSENALPQADSGISSFGSMGERVDESIGQQPIENSHAQTDSGISNFGRLSGELCWPHGHKTENTPPQADSGISKFEH